MQPPDQLVEYARQIAIHRAYPVLENGLQPLDDYEVNGEFQRGLLSKFEHEHQEFAEAVDIWHRYHEAADLLYYAACIDTQTSQQYGTTATVFYHYRNVCTFLLNAGLDPQKAELAALAKYSWRSEQPGNKNEEYEIELIKQTIE